MLATLILMKEMMISTNNNQLRKSVWLEECQGKNIGRRYFSL
jgi:hypothetical protein